jgi:hypothetical protein
VARDVHHADGAGAGLHTRGASLRIGCRCFRYQSYASARGAAARTLSPRRRTAASLVCIDATVPLWVLRSRSCRNRVVLPASHGPSSRIASPRGAPSHALYSAAVQGGVESTCERGGRRAREPARCSVSCDRHYLPGQVPQSERRL